MSAFVVVTNPSDTGPADYEIELFCSQGNGVEPFTKHVKLLQDQ